MYARLDVLDAGLDGGEVGHGTTNVDVNNPLREALSRIGSDDPLHLRVGPDELAVTTLDGPVVHYPSSGRYDGYRYVSAETEDIVDFFERTL